MRKISILAVILAVVMVGATVFAVSVGTRVSNVQLRDSNNRPSSIPDLGSKVVTIFYNTTNAADFSDPIATAIKSKDYPKDKYRGQGIANLADSAAPNFLIRTIIRKKEKQFETKIMTDVDRSLQSAWNLGDCNDTSLVIVIGKDRVVRYVSRLKSEAQGRGEVNKVLAVIEAEIAK